MMFDKHANLKYKFGNRHFLAEGYYKYSRGLMKPPPRNIFKNRKHDTLDK